MVESTLIAGDDQLMLEQLQKETFGYFLEAMNEETGLVADKSQPGAVCSIAAVGMALSCYVVGVERGYLSRKEALLRSGKVLDFLANAEQGTHATATGYKGFYYHFLDMQTGRRVWNSELSTMDTAIFLAGVITAQQYFTRNNAEEETIRTLADQLYRRVDWRWAQNRRHTISHGWKPEKGFLKHRWNRGYSEAILLYVLALGSPTFPIQQIGYQKWINSFEWTKVYDIEYIYAGPLFIHQMSHTWLDLRGIHDEMNRAAGIDYFENSRRATLVHQRYAIDNPHGFEGYGKHCWGITASDGPGPRRQMVNGVKRYYFNYKARGAPFGPDDGTVAPWAVVASLPFAPELVLDTTRHEIKNAEKGKYYHHGFCASVNPSFKGKNNSHPEGWVADSQFAINQGPVVLMIENYLTEVPWTVMKKSDYVVNGLRSAGFKGGWLDNL